MTLPTMSGSEALGQMVEDSGAKLIAVSKEFKRLADAFINRNPKLGLILKIGLDFSDSNWNSYASLLEGVSDDFPGVEEIIGVEGRFDFLKSLDEFFPK